MTRRAYGFAVGLALAVAIVAWVASYRYNLPLRDPDGLAGPSYIRLPAIVLLFYLADVVPRALIANRGPHNFRASVAAYTRERWTRSRVTLVGIGLVSFYVVYVAYRNLKGFLPYVRGELKDSVLMRLDRTLAFDHYPAEVLHTVLGTGISAHILAWAYELFLVFVPLSLGAALVWSKNVSTGFWYVTALCVNWVLGALSYYWVPSLGPFMAQPSLFADLPHTGVTSLQHSLEVGRQQYIDDPNSTSTVQSVAAFASLHVSIIFTAALICHYLIPSRTVRYSMWVYWVLTSISTVYFGWHYLLDDLAGFGIGLFAVWVGAKMTGLKMEVQRDRAVSGDGLVGVFPPESYPRSASVDQPASTEPNGATGAIPAGLGKSSARGGARQPAEPAGTAGDERNG
jgi:membrane-associated phospholipid phosphatase